MSRTPGIVTIVRTNGYPTPLRDEEIESVRIQLRQAREGDRRELEILEKKMLTKLLES